MRWIIGAVVGLLVYELAARLTEQYKRNASHNRETQTHNLRRAYSHEVIRD
jgi:hypothetical protein